MTDRHIEIPDIILDANVLIDYVKSAPNILKMVSKHISQLCIALPVLREVKQLSEEDVGKLGITIIEPSFAQVLQSQELAEKNACVSFEDTLSYIIARANNWICLTNDKLLRKICTNNNIACLWGFEIMLQLVSTKRLTAEKAYKIAQDIQSKNKYITTQVVEEFRTKLGL